MDTIRRFLARFKVATTDEELGRRTSVYPSEGRRSSQYPEEVSNPVIETSEKLLQFRLLLGITTHGSFKAPQGFDRNKRPTITTHGRPAPNRGIYVEVVDHEIKCAKNYKYTATLINSCLGIQIVVAATLTALGAAHASHGGSGGGGSSVTVFGAINTVIAGFLTYLKGSGLPNRIKYYQHEWSKVREYIEQRERDFAVDNDLVVMDEVRTIRAMYEEVQADVEASAPDRFVGAGNTKSRTMMPPMPMLAGGQINRISSAMSSPLEEKVHGLQSHVSGLQSHALGLEKELEAYAAREEGGLRAHATNDMNHLKQAVQDKMRELVHLERQIVDHGRKTVGFATNTAEEGIHDKVRDMGDLEKEIEGTGRRTLANTEREVEARGNIAVDDVAGRLKATINFDDSNQEKHR